MINGREERPRRFAFVADRRDWAHDNIAKHISALLNQFDVKRYYSSEYPRVEHLSYELYVEEKFDHIHFLGREVYFKHLVRLGHLAKIAMRRGIDIPQLAARLTDPVTTAGVYDHLFLEATAVAERQERFALLDAYATSSQRLFREYSRRYRQPPACVTQDGVNLELFRPQALDRFERHDRPLVIGWVGNSLWPRRDGRLRRRDRGRDPKGLRTLVIPAIERVRAEGMDVIGSFADRNVTWRSHESMPRYYAEIDILICASEHEGTPNPVLEAMACGVPVVSTDVGIVAEALGPEQTKLLMRERNTDTLVRLIRHLYEYRPQLRTLSQENLRSIQAWTWQRQVPKWLELFDKAGANHVMRRHWKRQQIASLTETAWRERHRWLGLYGLTRRLRRAIGVQGRGSS